MDTIYLHGVRAQTLIGWYDWERTAQQDVELDLDIGLPSNRASASDDLVDTIDYDLVVRTLRDELTQQHFLLLEALADFIARVLLERFGTPWVRVSVTKLGILQDVARVGVTIERGHRT
ncbi:dihydroneopterin aldolase [Jeongeupia naejangsanensis]|uniref:dihydroneopterin aldolase n=1 Tax=Jeongeupia naejangsanensis TaxID=613195 RepID=A0ABS2BGE7_9NEIS|nr:dihydroneopterin aldolase [Jeongeupia naejangsanensis]MBM3114676.1 dihydroneopterin aldolase [Jeongeupia naejangsanensis]